MNKTKLLSYLNLAKEDFGRFRAIYYKKKNGKDYIIVRARIGGGNRAEYTYVYAKVFYHPLYIKNKDLQWDTTYALIYFKAPEEVIEFYKDQEDITP